MIAKETDPKYIIISLAQVDRNDYDGVHAYARVFTTREDAAKWLAEDYNAEGHYHGWPEKIISEKDIVDCNEFSSPASDDDHDYVWKVIFQYE